MLRFAAHTLILGSLVVATAAKVELTTSSTLRGYQQHRTKSPVSVDLVVSVTLPLDGPLLSVFWRSVAEYWTPNVGKMGQILVLCTDCDSNVTAQSMAAAGMAPTASKIVFIQSPRCLQPYIGHQWSNFEASQHSTADLVVFADGDAVFHTPVDLEALGEWGHGDSAGAFRPYIIGRKRSWNKGGTGLHGLPPLKLDMMVQLPFMVHRSTLTALRATAEQRHQRTWDETWCHLYDKMDTLDASTYALEMPCDFCTMASFATQNPKEVGKYILSVEGVNAPVPRVASHLIVAHDALPGCGDRLMEVVREQARKLMAARKLKHPEEFSSLNSSVGNSTSEKVLWKMGMKTLQAAKSSPVVLGARLNAFERTMPTYVAPPAQHSYDDMSGPVDVCQALYQPMYNWGDANCWREAYSKPADGGGAQSGALTSVDAVKDGVWRYMVAMRLEHSYVTCGQHAPRTDGVERAGHSCSCSEITALVEDLHVMFYGQ